MPLTRIREGDTAVIADLSSGLGSSDSIKIDAFGKQLVSSLQSQFSAGFMTGLHPSSWRYYVDGVLQTNDEYRVVGRAEQKFGGGLFQTEGTAGSKVKVQSVKAPQYQPNRSIEYATAGTLPNPSITGSVRRWGLISEENGYFFEISEDGICYTVVRNNRDQEYEPTVDKSTFTFDGGIASTEKVYIRKEESGSLFCEDVTDTTTGIDYLTNTVTVSPAITSGSKVKIIVVKDEKNEITSNLESEGIDLAMENLFDIQVAWRGAADVYFWVRSKNSSGVSTGVKATYRNLGVKHRPSTNNPGLPSTFELENITGGGAISMLIGCVDISSSNLDQYHPKSYVSISNPNTPQITVGDITDDETFLLLMHNPTYHCGNLNLRDILLERLSVYAQEDCVFSVYKSSTPPVFLTGSAVWTKVNMGSGMLVDKNISADGTTARNDQVDTSSLQPLIRGRVAGGNTYTIDHPSRNTEVYFNHGDYIIVTAQLAAGKSGTTPAGATFEFSENI